ncbi:MAG: GNAT family N-acetyltransferase [Chitinophagales bacterium]
MQIRLAGEKDLESLVDLWIELMEYHGSFGLQLLIDKSKRAAIETFIIELLSKKNSRMYVMVDTEKVIALLIARIEQRPGMFIHQKSGYIAETIVSKSFQGKGIGEELANAAHQWFQEEHVAFSELQVSIQNDKAVTFWKSKGYEPQTLRMIRVMKN